ncbi:MAG: tRNA lysidine(34) synthetase TilS [Bacteroidales bacterium]|nr:tRNA lysidine(34) synthetase TilS [Bacteroidales bacterium]
MISQEIFIKNLSKLCPDYKDKKFLLAISGGIDSMVMLDLFKSSELSFAIAHVNFQLRGEESDRDMDFVFNTAKKLDVRIFERTVDTKKYVIQNKLNTQVAARKIRYDFFNEIADTHGFDYICTAHNSNDVVETLIMGLNRKGSITTLAGIRENENRMIRPILNFSREEIAEYAATNIIPYVNDSSNLSNKYLRNKIRHELTPVLEEIMPGFCERAAFSVSLLRNYQKYITKTIEKELSNFGDPYKEGINLIKLKEQEYCEIILMHFLLNNGFNPSHTENILNIENHSEPKEFLTENKKLLIHRGKIFLQKTDNSENSLWYLECDLNTDNLPINIKAEFVTVNSFEEIISTRNIAFLDANKIVFPILIRKWQPGERFKPLGMNNFKKIGDFFTDIKATIAERNSAMAIYSEEQVAWLIGYRIDDRFKIKNFPSKALRIELL